MKGTWIRQPTGAATVVFVHGVLSRAAAWQHREGTYWPQLLANDLIRPNLGVYVFEYETGFFSGGYRIGDIVDALYSHMKSDEVLDQRRIVFVCHSMGGIVVRRFIVKHQIDLINSSKEIGLFLIGSPSLGSEYATWLAPLARVLKHTQADALRFSQMNSWLLDLDRDFLDLKESRKLRMHGRELIEDKFIVRRFFLFKQVVEPHSGARYFPNPYKVPNSNHHTIANVGSASSIQHRLLLDFLDECETLFKDSPKDTNPDLNKSTSSAAATRSINVGRDAIGSVLIVGDNNSNRN